MRLGKDSLAGSTRLGQRTRKTKLRPEAVDTVRGIEVLDNHHLVAGGAALARSNGRPGKKELPDAIPALAVLGRDLLRVAKPVSVPTPEGARVVNADRVDTAVNGMLAGMLPKFVAGCR